MERLVWSRRAVLGGALAAVAACASDDVSGGGDTSTPVPTSAPGATAASTMPTSATAAPTPTAATSAAPTTTAAPTTVAPTTTALPAGYHPPTDGEWETTDADSNGWSDAGLDDVVTLAGRRNSRTFVMLAGGRILREAYFAGAISTTVQDIASCQKSITSSLVGIAVDRGLMSLDDTVSTYLEPGWSKARPAEEAVITIRHLITMTSGLHDTRLTKVAEPGTVWEYNTPAYQKTRPVLEAASGMGIDELTRAWIFDPIGVSPLSRWRIRPGARPDATGAAAWGIAMTARDMARYGLLVQRRGSWVGTQVVPSAWLVEALTPIPQKPDYGYLWWLIGRGHLARRGAPADAVAALGAMDQKIYVIPSADLVVARQGLAAREVSEAQSDFDGALVEALVSARA